MNRIQFWILTGLSGAIVLFLFLQVLLQRMNNFEQNRLMAAQQVITQGQQYDLRVRQLAGRIYQLSQQTQDQGLKDLLTRQQISVAAPPAQSPPADNTGTSTPAPIAPAPLTR